MAENFFPSRNCPSLLIPGRFLKTSGSDFKEIRYLPGDA